MTKQIIDRDTANANALSKVTVDAEALAWFQPLLKAWPTKWAGNKPSDAMLMASLVNKRPGVEALHIAMCLRPEGCTVQQFCTAGSCKPANNHRRQLVQTDKWFTVSADGKPYAYKLTFTPKGEAALAKWLEKRAAEKAAGQVTEAPKPVKKAKAKKASRKPKAANVVTVEAPANAEVAPVETPTSEAPAATEVATPAEVQALAAHFNG